MVRLDAGERLDWTFVALPGCSADLCVEVDLCGAGCEAEIRGLYVLPENECLDLRVLLRHNVGGCTSHQLFKGVVGGTARAGFDGLIYVAKDALKTKAYQENHNILLSEGARVESRPQLEIYADDVECSHGATTGYLNSDELFYMRSRGIPEAEARRLQIISFLAPVASRLPEDIQNLVYESISSR